MASPDDRGPARCKEAVFLQDLQECLPLTNVLSPGDLLYVLTPAVVPLELPPPGHPSKDPFEPFGRALAAYHPWVRHIPYTARDGITSYHASHLALARVVIFVVTGPPSAVQPSQAALSQFARAHVPPGCPFVVLVCCRLRDLGLSDDLFPTVVEIPSYSVSHLVRAANALFGAAGTTTPVTAATTTTTPGPPTPPFPMDYHTSMSSMSSMAPARWLVQEWDILRDPPAVHALWCQCLPARFRLDLGTLQRLLHRPGYAKHLVVRDPGTGAVLGFCATYTTFIDHTDSTWVGCVGAVLVQPGHRRRGIGSSLHAHALRQLAVHHVSRLKLGTTFPRLLYGLPFDLAPEAEDWFRRRGWRIDATAADATDATDATGRVPMAVAMAVPTPMPGCGREVCDWVLDFEDWRAAELTSGGLTFRRCEKHEFDRVLAFVARESGRKGNVGWYDQYFQLAGTLDMQDILLVLEGPTIAGTALSYVPRDGSRVAEDLPWARTLSDDVGGATCICITDDQLSAAHTRDSVMLRLLNFCVQSLQRQGMRKMFVDGISVGFEGFLATGFQKWAQYRDVWRDV